MSDVFAVALDGPLSAQGFSLRKRPLLRQFTGRSDIRFLPTAAVPPENGTLLVWGNGVAQTRAGSRVVRVEDGFLRSVGLGAELTRPSSWVLDDTGIYYDATRPSALEQRIGSGASPSLLARARSFRTRIVATGITKYNLPAAAWRRPVHSRRVVLACGQVETDASLHFGSVDVATNLALVMAVRRACPDAWLVYKPHPDVVAGLRAPGAGEGQIVHHCDEVAGNASAHEILEQVDEVHVMTSLIGFEAVLRGIPVVCHGWPFYAGWGLTRDVHVHPRRRREVDVDVLVAAALLEYPVYVSRETGSRCSPEQALEELVAWRARAPGAAPLWRRALRPLMARP